MEIHQKNFEEAVAYAEERFIDETVRCERCDVEIVQDFEMFHKCSVIENVEERV